MSNLRFVIVVVVLTGKPPVMGEVLCSTENSPFLIIYHIHAKINRVCCAALAIGEKCMNVRENKLLNNEETNLRMINHVFVILHHANKRNRKAMNRNWGNQKAKPALKTKTGKNKYYK